EAGVERGLQLIRVARCERPDVALEPGAPRDERARQPTRPEAEHGVLGRPPQNTTVLDPLPWRHVEAASVYLRLVLVLVQSAAVGTGELRGLCRLRRGGILRPAHLFEPRHEIPIAVE